MNLGLIDVNFTSTGNNEAVGGFIASGRASINNSYVTGSLSGSGSTGGLVGNMGSGGYLINNSYSTATISGGDGVGGLVGNLAGNNIDRSFATGNIMASGNDAGGLVGYTSLEVHITNSYSTGNVTGSSGDVGSFIGSTSNDAAYANASINNSYSSGYASSNGAVQGMLGSSAQTLVSVIDSYYDRTVSNYTRPNDPEFKFGVPKTTSELKVLKSSTNLYTNWSDSAWIFSDTGYPEIRLPPTFLHAPHKLRANQGVGSINLVWQAPLFNGMSAPTKYTLHRNGSFLIDINDVNTFSYTDSNLEAGKFNDYQISATNTEGESPLSLAITVQVVDLPSAPLNLTAVETNNQVSLTWDAPSNDGSISITHYNIYRNGARINRLTNTGQLIFSEIGLSTGSYTYYVTANNSLGEGPKSNDALIGYFSPPSEPLNLMIENGNGTLTLNWDAPLNAAGNTLTGYNIYRDGHLIDTTAINTLSYTDSNVTIGMTYSYNITANTNEGEGSFQ